MLGGVGSFGARKRPAAVETRFFGFVWKYETGER